MVDAADLKSADRKVVQVQVLSRAPNKSNSYTIILETIFIAKLPFGTIWHIVYLKSHK